jgi:enamine deaminase RidA (YjgF/YER057c/UK114 family)
VELSVVWGDPVEHFGVTGSVAMTEQPVELVRSVGLAAAVPYAYAATTKGRSLCVFTAGACPLDALGSTVAACDVVAQADQAMANLRRALHTVGAGLDDVVKTTVYVASSDRADLAAAWLSCAVTSGHTIHPARWSGLPSSGIPTN